MTSLLIPSPKGDLRAPSIQGRILFCADFEGGHNPATNCVSIAKEEKIEPDMDRVNMLVQYMASSNRVTPKVLIRRLRENGRLEDLITSVREDMVLDRLVELAEVAGAESK